MTDPQDEPETIEVESAPLTVRDLATVAGLLPETFKGNGRRPILFNHKSWQLKVALQRKSWTLDSQTTQQTFDAAIAEAACATAR
jgi:hypothetical protein